MINGRRFLAVLPLLVLTACAPDIETLGKAPPLSPVGSGVNVAASEQSIGNVEGLVEPSNSWVGGNARFLPRRPCSSHRRSRHRENRDQ